jgi:hypothetical protein
MAMSAPKGTSRWTTSSSWLDSRRWQCLVLLLALWSAIANAEDEPRTLVRARLEPPGPTVTGAHVQLVVDVLVTTWFTRSPDFPRLDVPGAAVIFPDIQPTKLNEQINGETWFGLSRFYIITPKQAGELAIPSLEITAYPRQTSSPVKLKTPALTLTVKAVPRSDGDENIVDPPQLDDTKH